MKSNVFLLLLIFLVCSVYAQNDQSSQSFFIVGSDKKVDLFASEDEIISILGNPIDIEILDENEYGTLSLIKYNGLEFEYESYIKSVVKINVTSPGIFTDKRIQIGDSIERIEDAYGKVRFMMYLDDSDDILYAYKIPSNQRVLNDVMIFLEFRIDPEGYLLEMQMYFG